MTIREPLPDEEGRASSSYQGNLDRRPATPDAPGPAAAAAAAAAEEEPPAGVGLPSTHPTLSYWLQAPSPLLEDFRSTPDLPATTDVVVIGSGMTGAFAADALLAGAGGNGELDVLLLEARQACFGATARNGGHCQPMLYAYPPDIAAFELATFRFLERLTAEHDIPCDWRSLPGGGVHAYLDEDIFSLAADAVAALRRTRPDLAAQVRVVKKDDADDDEEGEEREGAGAAAAGVFASRTTLASLRLRNAAGAVVQRHAASLWPYKLVAWVLERLVRASAGGADSSTAKFNLQTGTPVLHLARAPDATTAATGTTHPWLVDTARGRVAARAVLLATNAYTAHLVPALADLIVPVRGQVAALVPPTPPPTTTTTTTTTTTRETTSSRRGGDHTAGRATAFTSSSSSSSLTGFSSREQWTTTVNGITTTTTTTTKSSAPVYLDSSYIFVGHDTGRDGNYRDRDEYLIQRPFTSSSSRGSNSSGHTNSHHHHSSHGHGHGHHHGQGHGFAFASSSSSSSAPPVAYASHSSSSSSSSSGGHLVFGGGRQRAPGNEVGEWRDDAIQPAVARYLRTHLAPVLDVEAGGGASDSGGASASASNDSDGVGATQGPDDKDELAADFEWTGIMGYSRDQLPWVGPVPASLLRGAGAGDGLADLDDGQPTGLYISAGYTGHGMPRAALCGRAVAALIKKDLGGGTAAESAPTSRLFSSIADADDDDGGDTLAAAARAELPRSFLITDERIRQAREGDTVAERDARGLLAELREALAALV